MIMPTPATLHVENSASPPLSKNAQKKLFKAQRIAANKLERRAHEKEAKKEKKRERAAKQAAGEKVDEGPSRKKVRTSGPTRPFGARVVIDLGFDEKMTEKEMISLCSQLFYTYSAHRKAVQPFSSLLFTGLNGRTLARLEGMSDSAYKRWTHVEWWNDGYDKLWLNSEMDPNLIDSAQKQKSDKKNVVYLTADSEKELEELKEGDTYIIGGICDHNRYKNLCEDKAKAGGVRSARLPIGKYLAHLPTRKVLTVNQVYEILLKWAETRDWQMSLYAVIPKRKFQSADEAEKPGGFEEISTIADVDRDDEARQIEDREQDSEPPVAHS